jgi:hypothetical protein
MIRTALSIAVAAVMMGGTACDRPGVTEQQKEHQAAQDNADQQERAARESASAQADMNEKVTAAQADFDKTREDYRHSRETDLSEIDAKIAKLEAKATTATGKAKADLDAKLPGIRAQRASFGSDFRSLQMSTASTWDDSKARIDKEWESLKNAVDDAT